MNVGHPLAWWLAAAVSTAILTRIVLWWAARQGWLDLPIERSAHEVPVPSRGGIAIVVVCLLMLTALVPGELIDAVQWAIVAVAMAAVALIGLWDDFRPLPVMPRLLVQFVAVALVLMALDGSPPLVIASLQIPAGVVATSIVALAFVWFINLYNFMDGIDGIAAAEAVFICAVVAVLSYSSGDYRLAAVWAVTAGAASGFLIWNWAPARIFMGDVGSGFLGILIATLFLLSIGRGALPADAALIITAPFICDATLTLLRRVLRGERWSAGHRIHAYQWLAREWGSHAKVVFAMTALNLTLGLGALQLLNVLPAWGDAVTAATLGIWLVLLGVAGAGRPEAVSR